MRRLQKRRGGRPAVREQRSSEGLRGVRKHDCACELGFGGFHGNRCILQDAYFTGIGALTKNRCYYLSDLIKWFHHITYSRPVIYSCKIYYSASFYETNVPELYISRE